jgi:hypothetical protein
VIPVRVPADAKVTFASERLFTISPSHPVYHDKCPVCDIRFSESGQPAVLVFVGIAPEDRKPGGWTTGAAVCVHAACAGGPG